MLESKLLARYLRARRNIAACVEHKEESRGVAMQFRHEYFDGTRAQGYGGYGCDRRWIPIADEKAARFVRSDNGDV